VNLLEILADDDCWPLVGPAFVPPLDAGTPVAEGVEGLGGETPLGADGVGALASDGVAGEAGAGAPCGDPAAGTDGPVGVATVYDMIR